MNVQQIITIAIVAVAGYFLAKHLWKELAGLFNSSKAGHCASCGMCEPGKTPGTRAAPEIKTTPLMTVQPKLPPHLEKLRAEKRQDTPVETRG